MNDGMSEGMLGQSLKYSERFREEFVSETDALTLVPGRSCG